MANVLFQDLRDECDETEGKVNISTLELQGDTQK